MVRQQTIKKPPRLTPGDTIGVVAPASPFDQALFEKGVAVLENMGYRVFLPDGLSRQGRFLAGPDRHRAGLVNRMLSDKNVNGIFCARGGYGSMRLLDHIAFDALQANPKFFVGFSDITALLVTMVERGGAVAFHGPVLTTLGKGDQETQGSLAAAMTSNEPIELQANGGETLRPGRCTGIVTGGNLRTLCHLVGTPYAPNFRGRIVFLEDIGEAPYRIDRMLYHMRMAGCFEGMAGLALGTFDDCGPPGDVSKIVMDIFNDVDIPILSGFAIGHGPVNRTIPLGIPAELDTERQRLAFLEPAVT